MARLRSRLAVRVHGLMLPAFVGSVRPGQAAEVRELPLPPRPPLAATGTELAAVLRDLPLRQREERLFWEISGGNVPDFLRALTPVTLTKTSAAAPRSLNITSASNGSAPDAADWSPATRKTWCSSPA